MSLFLFAALTLAAQPPIVFVHGNGDDSSRWMGIIWLFESNGYPREKLHALRLTHPSARRDDTQPETNRSSATDQAAELSAAVTRALLVNKTDKIALIGSSRGGNTIRNYIRFGGGAANVSHAFLAGTPNHGVFVMDTNTGNEFNGKGEFLGRLNSGGETVAGIRYMTARSDSLDKYAQPNGSGYRSPELAGAENVVLPGLDHREAAFHPEAFRAMYRFLTGQEPTSLAVTPEAQPSISGMVTGFAAGAATNLPEAGVRLRVFPVHPQTGERESPTMLDIVTSPDGKWGPLPVNPASHYEFELTKEGTTLRYFRAPFPRSSAIVNLRFRPVTASAVQAVRPQGYFARERAPLTYNGEPVPGIPAGIPTIDAIPLSISTGGQLQLRLERIPIRPAATSRELHIAEFNWD